MSMFNTCDIFIFVVYGYLIFDILLNWNEYSTCYAPIQIFLLLTYTIIVIHKIVLTYHARQDLSRSAKKILNFLFYWILNPAFVYLTVQGIVWQVENQGHTPNCVPEDRVPWIIWWWIAIMILIDILLILLSLAQIIRWWRKFVFRRRVRRLMNEMHEMDDHVLTQILLSINQEEGNLNERVGLALDDIERLPKKAYTQTLSNLIHIDKQSCPICFEDFQTADQIITLPSCDHTFHSACISRWLLKSPLCPMCRSNVRTNLLSTLARGSEGDYILNMT